MHVKSVGPSLKIIFSFIVKGRNAKIVGNAFTGNSSDSQKKKGACNCRLSLTAKQPFNNN